MSASIKYQVHRRLKVAGGAWSEWLRNITRHDTLAEAKENESATHAGIMRDPYFTDCETRIAKVTTEIITKPRKSSKS